MNLANSDYMLVLTKMIGLHKSKSAKGEEIANTQECIIPHELTSVARYQRSILLHNTHDEITLTASNMLNV
ncbi:unnamed protein product [Schistosoma turkestanicum]|nr:unnamed protein product [Schistosoma turkestanicum]